MAADVAPALLEKIREDFIKHLEEDDVAADLLEAISSGKGTYKTTGDFAEKVGSALSKAMKNNLSSEVLPDGKMYWNIAERVVKPMLVEDYSIVSDAAVKTQELLNQAAGIGLKAQKATLNEDKVNGILNKIANAEHFDDVAWVLGEPILTFSRSIVDDTVKKNADFQARSGLRPKIIRRAESQCCKWCRSLAGEYEYPNVPKEVYQRHENCRCVIEYDPGDGKRQNAHTKKWTTDEESAKIETRRVVGLKVNEVTITEISEHVVERMKDRNVTAEEIQYAILKPLKIKPIKHDESGRPSFTVIGNHATITVNPETGKITTVYPTHTKTAKKLGGKR